MSDLAAFKRIAVFASGGGSNFVAIYRAIQKNKDQIEIVGLITNNSNSGAKEFAEKVQIPAAVINDKVCQGADKEGVMLDVLSKWNPDILVLAGYMKKISQKVLDRYRNRILNIHPAFLPSFGGKGMYGLHVHEAVLNYGVKYSGVTVHLVNEEYDTGPILMQEIVPVLEDDSPEILQKRILEQEHKIYYKAIKFFLFNNLEITGRRVRIVT